MKKFIIFVIFIVLGSIFNYTNNTTYACPDGVSCNNYNENVKLPDFSKIDDSVEDDDEDGKCNGGGDEVKYTEDDLKNLVCISYKDEYEEEQRDRVENGEEPEEEKDTEVNGHDIADCLENYDIDPDNKDILLIARVYRAFAEKNITVSDKVSIADEISNGGINKIKTGKKFFLVNRINFFYKTKLKSFSLDKKTDFLYNIKGRIKKVEKPSPYLKFIDKIVTIDLCMLKFIENKLNNGGKITKNFLIELLTIESKKKECEKKKKEKNKD